MIINLSNHPSQGWSREQTEAASTFGEIVDMQFPNVNPQWDEREIAAKADEICDLICGMDDVRAVHVAGEPTLVFALVSRLLDRGIRCVSSTTERISQELPDGKKLSTFRFVRLRDFGRTGRGE